MATPATPKPWKAEYAKSGRSSCKTCKSTIGKDALRLGRMVVATQFDGFMPMWHHAGCILKKMNQIKSSDDVEGLDVLRWEDQQKIRKYVEGGISTTAGDSNDDSSIEVSQTSRATCKHCNEKIMKGMVRISAKPEGQGTRGLAWHHFACFMEIFPSIDIEKVPGWDNIPLQDKETISSAFKKVASNAKKAQQTKEGMQQATTRETKRRKVVDDKSKSKAPTSDVVDSSVTGANLEKMLEEQNKSLWAIKDELKKHVTTTELRELLELNEQDPVGSEFDLRECCADGMLFGGLGRCPICSGSLHYSGGQFRCHGYVSAWSKCSYSTTEPVRLKSEWRIPEGTSNQYLLKWFKSQKTKKPIRVLPPQCSSKPSTNESSTILSQPSNSGKLDDLKVALTGEFGTNMEDLKVKLEEYGGKIQKKISKDTSCLIAFGEVHTMDPHIKKARRLKIPIVRGDYLDECIKNQKRLPFELFKIEVAGENLKSGMVTVKVKGRSAVHEASGLQDSCHILEDGKSIFNTTLNMSDLTTGINSYYILQVIQEDRGSDCYVFRKWGRVGNDKIGGNKLEEMSKSDAILEFKRLFLEKTENSWEAWEQGNFEKKPGKFCPLDIDYGIKQASTKKDPVNIEGSLPAQVVDLMNMLFNVETYRAAMMEFEINLSEMPLGKLSKKNIQKGKRTK